MLERRKMEGGIVSRYITKEKAKYENFKPVAPYYPMPKINWLSAKENTPEIDTN